MQLIGELCDGDVAMFQGYLSLIDDSTVDPLLGSRSTGLSDKGAQISLCDTQAIGIIVESVPVCTIHIHQIYKPLKHPLLSRELSRLRITKLLKKMGDMMNKGSDKRLHRLLAVIVITDY